MAEDLTQTERSLADKVAAAREQVEAIEKGSEAFFIFRLVPEDYDRDPDDIINEALDAQAAEIERLQAALDRSENSAHLLRTQLEGMRQELRDRDQQVIELEKQLAETDKRSTTTYHAYCAAMDERDQAKKELAEARQEAQEARKAAEWYSFMGPSINEAQDALQSVYRFFRIATNAMNRDKEPKPETEPGNTFNDCTLIMSNCKEACGQCEALTREEQEQAASMEDACSKMYQRFINRQ